MFKYNSQNQLSVFDFKTGFESTLNSDNRWVKLANLLDWDRLAGIYSETMCGDRGAGSIDARIVIGAIIIKHIEKKDDRGTIEIIRENPYMQYFLGLDHFTDEPVFDPSLFVTIRKRLGNDVFDKMNQSIIHGALEREPKDKSGRRGSDKNSSSGSSSDQPEESDDLPNKGRLQMDATVCDAYIKYPTDLNLLNDSREKAEELLDILIAGLKIEKRPRTYRRVARKDYLNIAKKKNKGKELIRQGIRKQLGYLKRDIGYISDILDNHSSAMLHLSRKEKEYLSTIQELYRQQDYMYRNKTNSVEHRIVSIHQPFIRPIVRGKDGKKVEFGSKINVSLMNGFTRVNQFDYEAFNESVFLQSQVESYKELYGYYPELVQTDDIYMTRANRAYLKERGIRHTGKPLGRKPKTEILNRYQKQKLKKEKAERNRIEGKFGQGKAGYNMNRIMARLTDTHESWVASIVFVMNILRAAKGIFCPFFRGLLFCLYFEKIRRTFPTIILRIKLAG